MKQYQSDQKRELVNEVGKESNILLILIITLLLLHLTISLVDVNSRICIPQYRINQGSHRASKGGNYLVRVENDRDDD